MSGGRWALLAALCAAAIATGCSAAITPLPPRGAEPASVPRTPPDASDLRYFDVSPLMVPVDGVAPARVPDSFNEPRDNGRIHRATDILVPMGTPVVAAEPGTIMRLSNNALGGITIYMSDDAGRFIYYYAHLQGYASGLAEHEHVSQGQIIAYVGMTGNAPVPHLHFQAMRRDDSRRDYWNGTAVDVRPFFTMTGKARATDAEQRAGESPR